MDGRHMFVCVFVSLSFSRMCCRSSCLCKWTVMRSISGRTGLCYCVTVDAFPLGEPGFVLHDRACVSACMCMYCMFWALYKIESHLCLFREEFTPEWKLQGWLWAVMQTCWSFICEIVGWLPTNKLHTYNLKRSRGKWLTLACSCRR